MRRNRPRTRSFCPQSRVAAAQLRSSCAVVYSSAQDMGGTCYRRCGAEQDKRYEAARGCRGVCRARCGKLFRGGTSTPCPTRGPPLSLFQQGKGGARRELPCYAEMRSVWGDGGHTLLGGSRGKAEGAAIFAAL